MSRSLVSTLAATAAIAVLGPASTALAAGGGGTGADLQISGSASLGSPVSGEPFSYTFPVKNSGPQAAFGTTFTDQLPAGTVVTAAGGDGSAGGVSCTTAADAGRPIVSCTLGTILSGGQSGVRINVDAPASPGTYANTGSVSSTISDPKPSNNAATVTVKVAPQPTCALPAGETTLHGTVMEKYTNASGLFEDFLLQVGGVDYYVKTNFYDGTRPLTSILNLLCRAATTTFIQGGELVDVTGTDTGTTITLPGTTTPLEVLDAAVVQVPFYFDKAV